MTQVKITIPVKVNKLLSILMFLNFELKVLYVRVVQYTKQIGGSKLPE